MKQQDVIEEIDIYRFGIALGEEGNFCKTFKGIYKKYSISRNVLTNNQTCGFDRYFNAK